MGNRFASLPSVVGAIYSFAVLIDLGISWYRSIPHFTPGVLVFHIIESAIKVGVMLLVLRGNRWACAAQIVLSALALLSGLALLRQHNARAAGDPLVWLSLAAQVVAGLLCATVLMRKTHRTDVT